MVSWIDINIIPLMDPHFRLIEMTLLAFTDSYEKEES